MTKIHAIDLGDFIMSPERVLSEVQSSTDSSEPKHYPFAPSSADRWLHCSASIKPSARRSSHAAREGTAAHLFLAYIIAYAARGKGPNIPEKIDIEGESFDVDEEMRISLFRLRPLWEVPDELWSEARVSPFPSHSDRCQGTSDIITWKEDTALVHVVDLKYGRTPVSAEGNGQLLLYALGAIRKIKKSPSLIKISIYQPRDHSHPYKSHIYGRDDFKDAVRPYLEAIERTLATPDQEEAGPWCKWCGHQSACQSFRGMMDNAMSDTSAPVEDTDDLERIARDYLPLKTWVTSAESRLRDYLAQGHSLEHMKLVRGSGRRRWAMEEASVIEGLEGILDAIDDVYTLKSIKQIADLIPSVYKGQFEELVTRGEPTLMLVSASDSRPSIGKGEEFGSQDADLSDFTK